MFFTLFFINKFFAIFPLGNFFPFKNFPIPTFNDFPPNIY